MKILYPLIKSRWNEEIIYSLRSIEKYFKDECEIFIIGYNHRKLINDIKKLQFNNHLLTTYKDWVPNKFPLFSQINVLRLYKFALFCRNCGDKEFIWMNDDYYFLKDTTIYDLRIPIFHGNLKTIKRNDKRIFNISCPNTYEYLKSSKLPTYNYECHVPQIFNVDKLLTTIKFFRNVRIWAYVSGYHNFNMNIHNMIHASKVRIGFYNKNKKVIPEQINNYKYLNHDDNGLSYELKKYLENKFPNKSKYEK